MINNIRIFSDHQMKRLEDILLFKMFGFKLEAIKTLLESESTGPLLVSMLRDELHQIDTAVNDLTYRRQLIRSLLNTYGSTDVTKQTIQSFISEQLYFKKERLIAIMTKADNLVLEIGVALIPKEADHNNTQKEVDLISGIKALRKELNRHHNLSLETMHIKDNPKDLLPTEFRILQNDRVLFKANATGNDPSTQVASVIDALKNLLLA